MAKERCYPEGIEISEEKASVPLQHLLDHTLTQGKGGAFMEQLGTSLAQYGRQNRSAFQQYNLVKILCLYYSDKILPINLDGLMLSTF